ncbi:8651_t:CDS:2 [Paraglomus occultum]|uniref:8651_t:CDS:1 n=1 Tax=Paraglomus occultum TaxID=144539 RepID=A0A9N8ZA86_9GLOM|nr:8651_t:CDS:2 [Paraglomus occultum]
MHSLHSNFSKPAEDAKDAKEPLPDDILTDQKRSRRLSNINIHGISTSDVGSPNQRPIDSTATLSGRLMPDLMYSNEYNEPNAYQKDQLRNERIYNLQPYYNQTGAEATRRSARKPINRPITSNASAPNLFDNVKPPGEHGKGIPQKQKPLSPQPFRPPPRTPKDVRAKDNSDNDSDDVRGQDLLRYAPREQISLLASKLEKTKNKLKAKAEESRTLRREADEKYRQYEEQIQELRNELSNVNQLNNSYTEACREKEELTKQVNKAKEEKEAILAKHENDRLLQQRAHESAEAEVRKLRKEMQKLKEEASAYQSALGSATNIRWSDDDSNNSVQLTKAINDLQHLLSDLCKVKGASVKINEEAAAELLRQYKCETKMTDKRPKPVLSACLQRLVLETIFSHIDAFINGSLEIATNGRQPPDEDLEASIISTTSHLVSLVSQFSSSRKGTDQLTTITPIKIRQQIYAILGSRAFVNSSHPFIKNLTDDLVTTMSRYRVLTLEGRKKEEAMMEVHDLIQQAIHLYFGFHAQEPVPDFKFFFESGEKLTPSMMAGPWSEDEVENLEVEICSFPLVRIADTNRVLSKAQVIPRGKNGMDELDEETYKDSFF